MTCDGLLHTLSPEMREARTCVTCGQTVQPEVPPQKMRIIVARVKGSPREHFAEFGSERTFCGKTTLLFARNPADGTCAECVDIGGGFP
jgi:hypothetical protein